MLCGNTLHRLIMLATHVFGVACAGTTLNLGGTESGLSFSYHGNPSPSGDGFLVPLLWRGAAAPPCGDGQGGLYITVPWAG